MTDYSLFDLVWEHCLGKGHHLYEDVYNDGKTIDFLDLQSKVNSNFGATIESEGHPLNKKPVDFPWLYFIDSNLIVNCYSSAHSGYVITKINFISPDAFEQLEDWLKSMKDKCESLRSHSSLS